MATDVLITSYDNAAEVSREISKLHFMLRMRGLAVLEALPADGLAALESTARDAKWVVVILDTAAKPPDAGLIEWLDCMDRIHAARSSGIVLVRASGPAHRTWLSERLRVEPITRLDLPLGFQRVCGRLGVTPFLGASPEQPPTHEFRYVDDTPATKDQLGRAALVEHVVETIQGSKRGMTISIEGPWGSGKSSFMNQLKEKLKKPPIDRASAPPFRIVEFNPWRLEKADSLWASFAIAFYEKVYTFSVANVWNRKERTAALLDLRARAHLAFLRYDIRTGSLPLLKLIGMIVVTMLCLIFIVSPASIHEPIADWAKSVTGAPRSEAHLAKSPPRDGKSEQPEADGSTVDKKRAPEASAKSTENKPEEGNDKAAKPTKTEEARDTMVQLIGLFLLFPSLTGLLKFIWSMKPMDILTEVARHGRGPDYEGKLPFIQQFQDDFAKVCQSFDHCRVAVIIDDIDRCEPAIAAELCQAISLMIPEKSGIVFIVAMDREKVAAGLAARAEKILPILAATRDGVRGFDGARALDYGFQFLEKSVQLSVRLPPAEKTSLRELVLATAQGDDDRRELIDLVASVLGNNPRRVKHFINVMSINDHLIASGETSPVTRRQLAKLLAITLRWPRIVPDLVDEPQLLAQLEELAVDPDARIVSAAPSSALARWSREEDLRDLLAQNIGNGSDRASAPGLTFVGVEVLRLLGTQRTASSLQRPLSDSRPQVVNALRNVTSAPSVRS